MLRIAVMTAHFLSSTQPTHGRPAYASRQSDLAL